MKRARTRAAVLASAIALSLAAAQPACKSKDMTPSAESQGSAPTSAPSPSATPTAGAEAPADTPTEHAAPALDGALSAEARERLAKLLDDGRALHEKKDYAGAIKVFQQALAIAPDDARALSELGWAALFAKDLDLAEASTRKAIERAAEPYLKASAYYNLGRIEEERGKPADAVLAYRRSLEHRLNEAVKARLAKLDPGAAAAFDILGVAPLRGPFVSLEGFCEATRKRARPERVLCDPSSPDLGDAFRGPSRIMKPDAPYLAVRVITSKRAAQDPAASPGASAAAEKDTIKAPAPAEPAGSAPEVELKLTAYHLAVRTGLGWFIAESFVTTYNPGAFGITENVEVKELAIRDEIPGGAPELLVRTIHYRGDSNMAVNELEEYVDEALLLCGVGPTEKPSCTRPIPVAWSEHVGLISAEMDDPGVKHNLRDKKARLEVGFLPGGELQIKGDPKELPDALKGLVGKHTLRFP